jgi:probable phosphoglycerate mutase
LVRHAQTQWNQDNRFQGSTDMPLAAAGLQQAQCLARRFQGSGCAHVYSSHLRRSQQTAQAIAAALAVPVLVDPGLAEMHLGEWEGLTGEEIDGRFGGAYRRWCRKPSSVEVPSGEPPAEFRRRAREAFARIEQRHAGGRIIIVSHGGVIASLLADWRGDDYDRVLREQALENASVTTVEWRGGAPAIVRINATEHLLADRRLDPVA